MWLLGFLSLILSIGHNPLSVCLKDRDERTKHSITLRSLTGNITLPRKDMNKIGDVKKALEDKHNTSVVLLNDGKKLHDDETLDDDKHKNMIMLVPIRGGMRVQVNTMLGEKVEVEVEETETVADLKKKLSKKQKIPADQQRIIYEGKLLQDNKTLAEYNIKNNSVIHMVLRLRGGQ